jgi:hypothetical protein
VQSQPTPGKEGQARFGGLFSYRWRNHPEHLPSTATRRVHADRANKKARLSASFDVLVPAPGFELGTY